MLEQYQVRDNRNIAAGPGQLCILRLALQQTPQASDSTVFWVCASLAMASTQCHSEIAEFSLKAAAAL